jgi:hypothetical protein
MSEYMMMSGLALAAQADGAGRVESLASTFGVNWPHLTAQIVSFAIVCALLYWLAYRPVLRMLEIRREQIAQGIANTEKINAALARIEAQRKEVIAEAQAQSTRLIAEAREVARACANRRRSRRSQPPSRSSPRRRRPPRRSTRACWPISGWRSDGWWCKRQQRSSAGP